MTADNSILHPRNDLSQFTEKVPGLPELIMHLVPAHVPANRKESIMSDVEHKVAVHRLAAERRAAGKPVWAHTIRLGHLFHDDELTFEQKRDGLIRLVKASSWFKSQGAASELHEAIEELADTENGDDFDVVMSAVYDMADYDRVWINR